MVVLRTFGTLLVVLLAMTVLPASPASAASSYRAPLDIHFPTSRSAAFSDDYASLRSAGRRHSATDLFVAPGSPVYAARSGRVVWMPTYEYPGSGYALWIRDFAGHTFAYYHLGPAGGSLRQAVAAGIGVGSSIRRGQYIGRVGDSGNAAGGSAHLHFEIRDYGVSDLYGQGRRNPYASLRAALGRTTHRASRSATRSTGLRLGSRGAAVARWQRQLNSAMGAGLAADGIFGAMTRAATTRFQRSAGLGSDGLGVVGPRSRAVMARRLSARTSRSSRPRTATALRYGRTGPPVVRWQRQLNQGASAGLAVDGVFGQATRAATIRFQRSAGLNGTAGQGVVGPRTRTAMLRRLRVGQSSQASSRLLRYGSRGAAVTRWQRHLNMVSHAGLAADGVFGPATRAATVVFQRSSGLGPDGLGIVGPRSRAAMSRRLAAGR